MEEFLNYKGKPLVRSGEVIYYGDLRDEYVVMLNITESANENDIKTAKKVTVQLLLTDSSLPIEKRIKKTGEKASLYDAMDLGAIWLERALTKK